MASVVAPASAFSLASGSPFAKLVPPAISTGHDMCRTILDATGATPCAVVPAPAAAEDVGSVCESVLSALVSKVADQLGHTVADEIKRENAVIGWLRRHANHGSPKPSGKEADPALRTAYDLLRNRPAFAKRLFADGAALAGLMGLAFYTALRCIVFVMKHEPKFSKTIFKTGKWKPILRMGASHDPEGRKDARRGLDLVITGLSRDDQDKILASDEIVACMARAFEDRGNTSVFEILDDAKKLQVRVLHAARPLADAHPLCYSLTQLPMRAIGLPHAESRFASTP
jgi:hypothetical protein